MSKKCLDCTSNVIDDLESDMENEVPLWYKKAGNYSLLPKLLNCDDKFNPEDKDKKFKNDPPKITDTIVKVPVEVEVYNNKDKDKDDKDKGKDKEPGTWIFYWASLTSDQLKIKGPEAAYGDESNSGLVKSDKHGKAELILNCPQPYRVKGITYPRHVHYTTVTKDNVWSLDVKTKAVFCHLDKKTFSEYLENKKHIIINALSKKSHKKKSIEGTLNLPVEHFNDESQIKKLIKNNIDDYPELKDVFKGKNKKNIPIITYCANKKCNASKNLAKKLMNFNYVNVVEYPGGIEEWFQKDDDKKDDDKEEDDLESLFNDDEKKDITNLKIKEETIFYECIPYLHDLKNDYIYEANDVKKENMIGYLDNKKIVFEKDNEEIHEQKKKELNEKCDMNSILDSSSDEETSEDEEDTSSSEDEDTSSSEEEEDDDNDNDKDKDDDTTSDDEDDTTSEEEEEEEEGEEEDEEEDEEEEEEEDEDNDSDDDTKKEEDKKEKDGGTINYKEVQKLLSGGGVNNLKKESLYVCQGGARQNTKMFRGWGFSFF